MSKWLRNAGQWLLIGTLFVSLGGHLVLLQTVAWGNMLVEFSKTESIADAAKKTFDGDHPCPMCKVVKESKKQEEKKTLLKAESKMDVMLPTPVRLKSPAFTDVVARVPGYNGLDSEVILGVPVQPPRSV